MNVPAQGQTRLVIVGAMGMVHRFAKLRVPRPRATGSPELATLLVHSIETLRQRS